MDIRGVGPSYGATGPGQPDPRDQARVALDNLADLTDKLKDDLRKGDSAAVAKDFADMQKAFADLNKAAQSLPADIQKMVASVGKEFEQIRDNIQQVTPEKLEMFKEQLRDIESKL